MTKRRRRSLFVKLVNWRSLNIFSRWYRQWGRQLGVKGQPIVAPLTGGMLSRGHIAHCPLLVARCPLLIAHCSLLVAHCSLLIAHCSLTRTQFSLSSLRGRRAGTPLPIAHCSLLIAHCSLPARSSPSPPSEGGEGRDEEGDCKSKYLFLQPHAQACERLLRYRYQAVLPLRPAQRAGMCLASHQRGPWLKEGT